MKKILIFICLLPFVGFSQTNWVDSLAKFEKKDSKKSYGWFDSLTAANQTQHIREWFSLKIKASIEARLNNVRDSNANITNNNNARQAYILHLQGLGFTCDNSKADWIKACNHPEWFGANWKNIGIAAWQNNTGLNDFLNFCRQYNY